MSTLADLRKTAQDATPGPWKAVHPHSQCTEQDDEASGLGLHIEGPPEASHRGWLARGADARFMATFDPELVSALLDVAEAARQPGTRITRALKDALDRLSEVI